MTTGIQDRRHRVARSTAKRVMTLIGVHVRFKIAARVCRRPERATVCNRLNSVGPGYHPINGQVQIAKLSLSPRKTGNRHMIRKTRRRSSAILERGSRPNFTTSGKRSRTYPTWHRRRLITDSGVVTEERSFGWHWLFTTSARKRWLQNGLRTALGTRTALGKVGLDSPPRNPLRASKKSAPEPVAMTGTKPFVTPISEVFSPHFPTGKAGPGRSLPVTGETACSADSTPTNDKPLVSKRLGGSGRQESASVKNAPRRTRTYNKLINSLAQ
jgi:hypothetical protein